LARWLGFDFASAGKGVQLPLAAKAGGGGF